MPANKEKVILVATSISAIVNIGMNFCLIPIWKENATAFTTFVAEFILFLVCVVYGLKITKIELFNRNMLGVLVGCAGIICVCKVILFTDIEPTMQLIGTVFTSGIVYGLTLILFHNDLAWTILRKVYRTYEK